jgi:glycosyltransferase involved in cell wall biosynthesis
VSRATEEHRVAPQTHGGPPRRILWVMKGLGRGGAERLVATSVRHFDPQRYLLEVAYVLPWKDAFVEEIQDAAIPVHCVGDEGWRLRWLPRLRSLIRSRRYDLVHTHSPVPALAVRTMSQRTRPPLVHTEHNVWDRYRYPTRIANALTFGENEAVLTVSNGVLTSIRRPPFAPWLRMPPASVLHHGIDPDAAVTGAEARARGRALLGLDEADFVLGTVANFTPKKDQASLLQAVRILRDRHPAVRLVLVGNGPLERDLRQRAQSEGIGDRVIFAGSRSDVLELLPAFDVFVLSSLHEGLSIALLEAMATCVPPVATAVGGVPEVITDGVDGFLVPPRNPPAMAAVLERLIADPELRRAVGEKAEVRSHDFGIARAVRAMESFYDEVLA